MEMSDKTDFIGHLWQMITYGFETVSLFFGDWKRVRSIVSRIEPRSRGVHAI